MAMRPSSDKVIFLTLIDLLLQLLFVFLFAILVISKNTLSKDDWKRWNDFKEAVGKYAIKVPSFGPTWQKGQACVSEKKDWVPPEQCAPRQPQQTPSSTPALDVKKPFLAPCIPSEGNEGKPKRVYIARFVLKDEGIQYFPSDAAHSHVKFREVMVLLNRQIKESGQTTWSGSQFRDIFRPFRDGDCEYYALLEDKMESNDKLKYKTLQAAVRFSFGPNRTP